MTNPDKPDQDCRVSLLCAAAPPGPGLVHTSPPLPERNKTMSHTSPLKTRRRVARRWRHLATAIVAAAAPSLPPAFGPAAVPSPAGGASAASADAPTAPPPVKVLVHGNVGHGDFFVSPF